MILSFSDLLEALFLGSVGRTKKKKPEISIFIMSIDEKNWLVSMFFLRRQKISWVGSLEKLKINDVWPYVEEFAFQITINPLFSNNCQSTKMYRSAGAFSLTAFLSVSNSL